MMLSKHPNFKKPNLSIQKLNRVRSLRKKNIKIKRKNKRTVKKALDFDFQDIMRNQKLVTSSKLIEIGKTTHDNQVEVFFNGSDMYRTLWDDIDKAVDRVWIQTYILEPDYVGLTTISKLRDAAKRGCQVILLFDYVGSLKMLDGCFQELIDAGGTVIAFRSAVNMLKTIRIAGLRKLWFRTHRKIIIIDDVLAYCGGMNISQDYCSTDIGTGRFRDTHARIMGSCAKNLAEVYERSLRESARKMYCKILSKTPFDYKKFLAAHKTVKQNPRGRRTTKKHGDIVMHVLESEYRRYKNPGIINNRLIKRTHKRTIQQALLFAIENAKRNIYLTTPYFLPPAVIRKALISAAQRGVDVRIITGSSDWMFVRRAARNIYPFFLKNGVRVYEYEKKDLHAKGMTVDGYYSTIGSYNLDNLSYSFLLEAKVGIVDMKISSQIEKHFLEVDIPNSIEETIEICTNRSLVEKTANYLCYNLARFLLG